MRKELKRCNFLGNAQALHYLVSVAIVDHPTDMTSVKSLCSLNNNLNLNSQAAIYFLEEVGLIAIDASNKIIPTDFGKSFLGLRINSFMTKLSEAVFLYLIENGMINLEAVSYDPVTKLCHIKRSGFPLNTAAFRNLLIEFKALEENSNDSYQVNEFYEPLFELSIKKHYPKLTLEDLMEKQRRQEEQGRLAEEFVVAFERERLSDTTIANNVKQISDIDVTAGYDILSYNNGEAKSYNRFIEVKSFHTRPQFFWSSNEFETASKLGDRYFLYLVDIEQYLQPGYQPLIVQNPTTLFCETENWLVETASWKISKI